MDNLKGIAKGGWHPQGKGGKKEGWRNDFKGVNQIAGWMGKGKESNEDPREHVSQPLSSLKDPASFAPPPKHSGYYGAAAAPNAATSDRGGSGAPLPPEAVRAQQGGERPRAGEAEEENDDEESNRPKAPPAPFRVATTGLSTAHLPKPPVRRLDRAAPTPPPAPAAAKKPPGSLPPPLPPRQNSHPDATAPRPPPAYSKTPDASTQTPYLNQTSLNRLTQSGISVPGFNIGQPTQRDTPSTKPPFTPPTSNTQHQTPSPSPSNYRSALQTARSLHQDPASVSLSDARAAASTANGFRERHGDQVAAGVRTVGALESRFGGAERLAGGGSNAVDGAAGRVGLAGGAVASAGALVGKRAPPPPPPPKRREVLEAPPVPLASKPRS
ncbi:hypothetical protein LTR66_010530 [Elasticomyces elasticus]|nr:hypothetical protein LTR66_010530 [Elasticomyces elasticus]